MTRRTLLRGLAAAAASLTLDLLPPSVPFTYTRGPHDLEILLSKYLTDPDSWYLHTARGTLLATKHGFYDKAGLSDVRVK